MIFRRCVYHGGSNKIAGIVTSMDSCLNSYLPENTPHYTLYSSIVTYDWDKVESRHAMSVEKDCRGDLCKKLSLLSQERIGNLFVAVYRAQQSDRRTAQDNESEVACRRFTLWD